MSDKFKVLFLCTGNSCRSQMAEGWARHLRGDDIVPYSAGLIAHGLNPRAVKVMAEAGVDISGHQSNSLDEMQGLTFDFVVTVCGHADEHCPAFPGGTKVIYRGFDDQRGRRQPCSTCSARCSPNWPGTAPQAQVLRNSQPPWESATRWN